MKDWFKKIWIDPVWSKVIAAAIIAAVGVVFSLLKTLNNDSETLEESFKTVFSYKVNLWLAIVVMLVVLIIIGVIKKINASNQRIIVPPFVNEFIRGQYQNQMWKWRWEWNVLYNYYCVTDLNIECPNCHKGVLDLEFMSYRCPKCNSSFEFSWINGNPEGVKKQILEDARTQYCNYKKFIGE